MVITDMKEKICYYYSTGKPNRMLLNTLKMFYDAKSCLNVRKSRRLLNRLRRLQLHVHWEYIAQTGANFLARLYGLPPQDNSVRYLSE